MPQKAWSAKRERQYEHIKESLEERGTKGKKAEEIAARTVNKERARAGEATVALRPHLIWGPRDNHLIPRLIARAKSGRLRRVGRGDNLLVILVPLAWITADRQSSGTS